TPVFFHSDLKSEGLALSHCHRAAERSSGLEIDHETEASWLLTRQIASFGALENTIDIARRSPEHVSFIGSIGNQTAVARKKREIIDCRQTVLTHGRDNCLSMSHVKAVGHGNQAAVRLARECVDSALNLGFVVDLDRNGLYVQ